MQSSSASKELQKKTTKKNPPRAFIKHFNSISINQKYRTQTVPKMARVTLKHM